MALDLTTLLTNKNFRQWMAEVLAAIFLAQTEDQYSTNATAITTAKAAFDTAANGTVVTDASENATIKTQAHTIIDGLLQQILISDVLAALKTILDTAVEADTIHFPYKCQACAGTGRVLASTLPGYGDTASFYVNDPACDGFGRLDIVQHVTVAVAETKTYGDQAP